MKTSYFANLKKVGNPLSISGRAPEWYTGPQFKTLAPLYWFFKKYKDGEIDKEEYTKLYNELVLGKLDARVIYDQLTSEYGDDVTLLCYEKPGDFCHRHLVAEWFENELGVVVNEVGTSGWKI